MLIMVKDSLHPQNWPRPRRYVLDLSGKLRPSSKSLAITYIPTRYLQVPAVNGDLNHRHFFNTFL